MKLRKIFNVLLLVLLIVFMSGCSINGGLLIGSNKLEKHLFVGDVIYLTSNQVITTNDEVVEWTSSNVSVVTVDQNGIVKAISAGTATISAKFKDQVSEVIIYVSDLASNPKIEISGKQYVIIGETTLLTASSNVENTIFIWESSDETIATVDQDGVVKGIKPGVVTIKVYAENYSSLYKEILVLVRTGDGIQEIIQTYIEQNIYITEGDYNLKSLNDTVVNMVKSVEKSVIGIANYSNIQGTVLASTGTGGIYKKEATANGYKYTAFTNQHVIEDAKAVKVYLGDIDEYVNAQVIKSDETMDIAIVTFEHINDYEVLKLGTIGSINTGDFIIAIGNPGGFTYYGSVTFGMISASTRKMKDSNVIYVQHDAPINPGNSGGPLFNLNGEVIGINTLKLAASDIEGMGFAIAMETFLEYLQ